MRQSTWEKSRDWKELQEAHADSFLPTTPLKNNDSVFRIDSSLAWLALQTTNKIPPAKQEHHTKRCWWVPQQHFQPVNCRAEKMFWLGLSFPLTPSLFNFAENPDLPRLEKSRCAKIPSGKHTKNYGKSPFLMGKSTISMEKISDFYGKSPFFMGKSTINGDYPPH